MISSIMKTMSRQEVLDMYFMDARHKLIDLAAFMDRVDRSSGIHDFRMQAFDEALKHLRSGDANRAGKVLMTFSDPSTEPIKEATTKAACGAWPGSGAPTLPQEENAV